MAPVRHSAALQHRTARCNTILHRRAVAQHNCEAMFTLGECYEQRKGVVKPGTKVSAEPRIDAPGTHNKTTRDPLRPGWLNTLLHQSVG